MGSAEAVSTISRRVMVRCGLSASQCDQVFAAQVGWDKFCWPQRPRALSAAAALFPDKAEQFTRMLAEELRVDADKPIIPLVDPVQESPKLLPKLPEGIRLCFRLPLWLCLRRRVFAYREDVPTSDTPCRLGWSPPASAGQEVSWSQLEVASEPDVLCPFGDGVSCQVRWNACKPPFALGALFDDAIGQYPQVESRAVRCGYASHRHRHGPVGDSFRLYAASFRSKTADAVAQQVARGGLRVFTRWYFQRIREVFALAEKPDDALHFYRGMEAARTLMTPPLAPLDAFSSRDLREKALQYGKDYPNPGQLIADIVRMAHEAEEAGRRADQDVLDAVRTQVQGRRVAVVGVSDSLQEFFAAEGMRSNLCREVVFVLIQGANTERGPAGVPVVDMSEARRKLTATEEAPHVLITAPVTWVSTEGAFVQKGFRELARICQSGAKRTRVLVTAPRDKQWQTARIAPAVVSRARGLWDFVEQDLFRFVG